MASEEAGRCKFAEFMANHIFRNVDGNMFAAVMNSNGMPQEFRENRRAAAPSLDDFLFPCSIQGINFLFQAFLDVRSFFTDLDTGYASFPSTWLFRSAFQDQFAGSFLVLPGTSTKSTLAPRSNRTLTTNRGVTFTTAMRMVVRVHRNTAVSRTDTKPTGTAGFTKGQVFVIQVADFADGCTAVDVDLTELTRGETEQGIAAFLSHELDTSASRTAKLTTFADFHFDVVDHGTKGDIEERQRVADLDISFGTAYDDIADLQA